jgi:Ethylbenzene dehydrogenase/Carbohydrate family 9 binding domain-like
MKLFRTKYFWVISTMILAIGYFVSCTKDDQIINTPGSNSSTDLVSLKATTAPTIDGTIDAAWDNATQLDFTATVPDPGNNLFTGYIGTEYTATIRSMYDDQFIYFLVEVPDIDKNVKSAPWYFNPSTRRWAQEPTSRTFNASGILTREGWGEDKMAMLWNVDNSTPKFISQTCYASCHVFTPYVDYSGATPVAKSNASNGNHYTNGASEKIDMWWAHPNRGLEFGKMDDNYQDWAGGPGVTSLVGGSGNGRHFDDLVVSGASSTWPNAPTYTADATQGSVNNRQSLKLDDTGVAVTVPMWVFPNDAGDFIKTSDTLAGGTVVRITGVSSTGVLTYDGGTIDPNIGTDYQRTGDTATGSTAAKSFPGVIISPLLNGRADIDMSAVYSAAGWIYEFKRLLKTADVLKQDIDFTGLSDQPFGVAIWNKSNYQHGIKPNLMLKFQQ